MALRSNESEPAMATDYDAPRKQEEESPAESLEALQASRSGAAQTAVIDVDENDTAEGIDLPGADLSNEELTVIVVPPPHDGAVGGQRQRMGVAGRDGGVTASRREVVELPVVVVSPYPVAPTCDCAGIGDRHTFRRGSGRSGEGECSSGNESGEPSQSSASVRSVTVIEWCHRGVPFLADSAGRAVRPRLVTTQ